MIDVRCFGDVGDGVVLSLALSWVLIFRYVSGGVS